MLNGTQARKIRDLSSSLERIMNSFGYKTVDMPVIENADLFLTKAGDQVIEKLFTFERYGKQLALRPEFTAAAAYHYATQTTEKVVRWQFHGPIFEEYSRGDVSSYQQYSIGAELIGTNSIAADVEIMVLALQGIIDHGIDNWTLKIGHAGVLREALSSFDLDPRTERFILNHRHLLKDNRISEFREALDKYLPETLTGFQQDDEQVLAQTLLATIGNGQIRTTMGGRTREDIATRIVRKNKQVNERGKINEVLELISAWASIQDKPEHAFSRLNALLPQSHLMTQWESMISRLADYGVPSDQILIQPDLVRNWDYYTGVVFDIVDHDGYSLCGGGRYDELIGLVSDHPSAPAVGFAYDANRLAERLPSNAHKAHIILKAQNLDAPETWRWLSGLRQQDLPVSLLMPEQTVESTLVLNIDQSGRIIFQQNSYEFNELEKLVAEIANNAR